VSTIEIRHRWTVAVLWSGEAEDLRAAVKAALAARAYLADANLARANLADANLAGANLADADLAGAYLADANLARAYLAGAYLADAYLAGANLADANLAGANLAGANLADARNLPAGTTATSPPEPYVRKPHATPTERMLRYRERHPEVPVVERLDACILEAIDSGAGTLDMSRWHSCETTHCVAGWAIHLAGEKGYALERDLHDSQRAGRAIYLASTGHVPDFFASNERAIEGLRRRAAEHT
jgi:hypothetical protein